MRGVRWARFLRFCWLDDVRREDGDVDVGSGKACCQLIDHWQDVFFFFFRYNLLLGDLDERVTGLVVYVLHYYGI